MVGHTGGPHRATRKMSLDYSSGGASNRVDNKSSQLLSKDENDQIFRLLGHKCQTLATAVVQLYTSEPPQHMSWVHRDTGVLCLVKDNVRRSYFFRLYCLQRSSMVWEHEVYNHIEYRSPRTFLHTFEAEDGVAAFNFASEREAYTLRATLLEKMEAKKQRKMERRSRQSMGPPPGVPAPKVINGPTQALPMPGPKPTAQKVQHSSTKWNKRREKESARRLTKADIGLPQDFRHVTHVGWDPNKGFDLDNVEDPQLKQFFVKAGVSENQLKDKETREFIYDFIIRHGGIEAVKEEVIQALPQAMAMHQNANQAGPPPPVPARSAPPQSESKSIGQVRSAPPPPPPSRTQAAPAAPSPAPPPPPVRTLPPHKAVSPEQVSAPAPPPPPPPPPMVPLDLPIKNQAPTPTPSITSTTSSGSTADPRSALMDAIRSGKQLKHVEPPSATSGSSTMTGDARGELLDQIRQGIELRPVVPSSTSSASKQDVATQDTLAGALARALAERSRAIHSDSSSDTEDEEEDDEEWED